MTEDYPRTLLELEQRFSDEAKCRDYLFALRWPQGFICPVCGAGGLAIRRDLWRCVQCGRETSVMAGTIFQDSKLPFDGLVSGDVAGDFPEEWRQCPGFAAGARF